MERCGLPPRGPHALRHTFATRLLRTGQPIKAIADLLGHRSLSSIAIYAKVDVARLLEVAVEWPEVLS
jgi:site-specific recombinase XerD